MLPNTKYFSPVASGLCMQSPWWICILSQIPQFPAIITVLMVQRNFSNDQQVLISLEYTHPVRYEAKRSHGFISKDGITAHWSAWQIINICFGLRKNIICQNLRSNQNNHCWGSNLSHRHTDHIKKCADHESHVVRHAPKKIELFQQFLRQTKLEMQRHQSIPSLFRPLCHQLQFAIYCDHADITS